MRRRRCRCSWCARKRERRAKIVAHIRGYVVVSVAVLLGLLTFAACVAAVCRGMP